MVNLVKQYFSKLSISNLTKDLTKQNIIVTFYTKPGCCLCEKAWAVVADAQRNIPFILREVDISTSHSLERRYFDRIPVVALNGKEVFEHQVHVDELMEELIALEKKG